MVTIRSASASTAVTIDTLIILNPRYKTVGGEQVLDLEATAKASVIVKGIGGKTNG